MVLGNTPFVVVKSASFFQILKSASRVVNRKDSPVSPGFARMGQLHPFQPDFGLALAKGSRLTYFRTHAFVIIFVARVIPLLFQMLL